MTTDERAIVEALDRAVRSGDAQIRIRPIVERVRTDLARKPNAVMTWEPIPLTTYSGGVLPGQIESSWIFVLRAGANTGAERHPNSHQRMMSFAGTGDMQIGRPKSEAKVNYGADIEWQSNLLISNQDAPLEKRWISIPQNVWHQPVVSQSEDWVVVSFHTVPAEQLIEERPDDQSASGTTQMVYLEKSAPASFGTIN
jgi:hypothetical protein